MINATQFWIEPIEKESASLLTAVKLKQKNAEELLCCTSVVEPIQAPMIYAGGSEGSPSEEFWRESRWMHFCPSPCLQLSDLLSHIFYFWLTLIILQVFSSRLKAGLMWWGGSTPSVLWLSLGSLEWNQELHNGCSADWVPGQWIGRKLPNIDCKQASDINKSWFALENAALILSVPISCWIILFNNIIHYGRRPIRQNSMLGMRGKQKW